MPGPKPADLTGRVFGHLTAVERVGSTGNHGGALWRCRCDCGAEKEIPAAHLTRATKPTRSCGGPVHVVATRHRTHGRTKSPEYGVWRQMVARCTKPDHKLFPYYGGRGITVCGRWLTFEGFLSDMGERPSATHTLERKDNDGPYSPDNCVWATKTDQQRNKRDTHKLTYRGATKPLATWAEQFGIRAGTIRSRLRYGWSVERAITEPV
jgi:hypothetical protein